MSTLLNGFAIVELAKTARLAIEACLREMSGFPRAHEWDISNVRMGTWADEPGGFTASIRDSDQQLYQVDGALFLDRNFRPTAFKLNIVNRKDPTRGGNFLGSVADGAVAAQPQRKLRIVLADSDMELWWSSLSTLQDAEIVALIGRLEICARETGRQLDEVWVQLRPEPNQQWTTVNQVWV